MSLRDFPDDEPDFNNRSKDRNNQGDHMDIISIVGGLVVGGAAVFYSLQANFKKQLEARSQVDAGIREAAEREAANTRREAENEANRIRENAEIQNRAKLLEEKTRLDQELKRDRDSLTLDRDTLRGERESFRAERDGLKQEREESRLEAERLSRRAEQLDARTNKLDQVEEKLDANEKRLGELENSLNVRLKELDSKLYEVANLTKEQAAQQILSKLELELEDERAVRVKAMMQKAQLEVKRQSQNIIAQAIQRSASETTAQVAVSVVPIPSDAMKGRIIGREGRNIRAFEALTGVDLIIDDTPEAVILSSFNPIRREVAVKALEQLVTDGRIHPTRIEEVVGKAQDEMKNYILERGEEAAIEANVVGLKPGLLQLMGRMHFRSSYAQNVLKHSIQVAHLCGIMAAELGLDAGLARRAGLLHDVGKSIDREIEGTHVDIGINLAKRFGEPLEVIDAIAHHHDPENGETIFSVLAAAADAISAARPGARREDLETYIKRLEQLETIATSFPGVEHAYAIQAGREVRVIVQPERVNDSKATLLARDIASRIEQDMEYPGQVQVTVVRETRSVNYAR